jgi:hypothetical protein
MKRCCVPACEDKTSRRYAIPSEQRIHAIWIERIGNPKLLGLDPKNLSRNYRVCKNHFAENCIDASDRLLRYALPTLNLHAFTEGSTEENCFSRPPEERKCITPDKLKGIVSNFFSGGFPSSLSTLPHSPEAMSVKTSTKTYSSLQAKRLKTSLFDTVLKGSVVNTVEEAGLYDLGVQALPSTSSGSASPTPRMQHDSSVRTPKKSKGLLQSVGVTRQNHLSPKAKFFYKRTKALQQVAAKLRSKGMSVNRKLNYLAKKEGVLRYLKDVNEITADFVFVPITNTKI